MASESATISYNKIDLRFDNLRADGRKALVCYITAGHPDRQRSLALLKGLEDSGADVIELGVPFSDPIADGPIIQESSQIALAGGMTLDASLELVAEAGVTVPVVLFTYLNPLLSGGADVLSRTRDAGIDGVLVTDLPVGADEDRERWLGESDLAFIRLVAPTTPLDRMKEIARNGSGFVYLISRLGVTGAQKTLAADLPETASRLRSATNLPICVGFGVSEPAQARAASAVADGVVVGSAIVRAAQDRIENAFALVRSLRTALDS
jgi:tryptophan synthase alpha chain